MLTAYMTEMEVKMEVLLDGLNAFRYEDNISNKFRRRVLKATRFPVYSQITYMSPRKNRWLFCAKRETGMRCSIIAGSPMPSHTTPLTGFIA